MKRFWEKVAKGPGCWEWQGAKCSDGYGNIKIDGKVISAHRLSWSMQNGHIPDGMCIMHTCDNPACVKPQHLKLGTQLKNIADRDNKGRTNKGTTHPDARLTPKVVREIRENYKMNPNYNALGRQYNVSAASIRKVVLRESWKHV